MIKNIIFDFGDVFINLNKAVILDLMAQYGISDSDSRLDAINRSFEVGRTSPDEFLAFLHAMLPNKSITQLKEVWNSMLLDLPEYRLDFVEDLAREGTHRLFLLSNTNSLHIPHVSEKMGKKRFERFKNSFEGFYLSHEIYLRKPDSEIFNFVLHTHHLDPDETLFVDDTAENTDAAAELGIHTWNLKVGSEDIIDLKTKL
jgi:putative hydrolase of the HAD superfamily